MKGRTDRIVQGKNDGGELNVKSSTIAKRQALEEEKNTEEDGSKRKTLKGIQERILEEGERKKV